MPGLTTRFDPRATRSMNKALAAELQQNLAHYSATGVCPISIWSARARDGSGTAEVQLVSGLWAINTVRPSGALLAVQAFEELAGVEKAAPSRLIWRTAVAQAIDILQGQGANAPFL